MVKDCALLRAGDERELFQQGQLFQKGHQQDATVWTHTQWFFMVMLLMKPRARAAIRRS